MRKFNTEDNLSTAVLSTAPKLIKCTTCNKSMPDYYLKRHLKVYCMIQHPKSPISLDIQRDLKRKPNIKK